MAVGEGEGEEAGPGGGGGVPRAAEPAILAAAAEPVASARAKGKGLIKVK